MTSFAEVVQKLQDPLSSTIEVTNLEIFKDHSYHDAVDGILKEPKKRRDRTDAQVIIDVCKGKACELGIKKLIPDAHVHDSEWVVSDRHSYGKDVVTSDGIRIEVKSTQKPFRFALAMKSWNTLCTNIKEKTLDVIVTAFPEYDANAMSWKITPQMIIDPCTFEKLCDIQNGFTTMKVYRDDLAASRNYVAYVNRKDDE